MTGFTKKEMSPLQRQRKIDKARKALGLAPIATLTAAAVRGAFAEQVKSTHPDAATVTGGARVWEVDLNTLRKSKDFLLKELENGNV